MRPFLRARISFFVKRGRPVRRGCTPSLARDAPLWEELDRDRYGVRIRSAARRFPLRCPGRLARLTESQPENNVQRIRARGASRRHAGAGAGPRDPARLERGARAAAAVGPAGGRCGSSRRLRDRPVPVCVLADGRIDGSLAELAGRARAEMARVEEQGGAVEAVRDMKAAGRVAPRADRPDRVRRAGARRRQPLPATTEPSPLTADAEGGSSSWTQRWRPSGRGGRGVAARRATTPPCGPRWPSSRAWRSDKNVRPRTIAAARAGATTGEWAQALREAFGSDRAPTGVGEAAAPAPGEEVAALPRRGLARVAEPLGRG